MAPRLPRLLFVLPLFTLFSSIAFPQQFAPKPLITQPVLESHLTTLRGNTHPLARPQFDIGAAPPDLPMNRMLLVLKRSSEQEHALITMLDNQHDRLSPQYHKWLTPDEFGVQFGPSDEDLQTISGWLQSHGFEVNRVSKGRSVIEFSGYESQVEAAFHTAIHKYLVNGEEHWANANDPQIPTALVPAVAGVASLNNFPRKPFSELLGTYSPKTRRLVSGNPHFTFGSGNCFQGECYAVGPADLGAIYNLQSVWSSGIDGTGQTIAIVAESDINLQDVRDFRTLFGLPAKDPNVIYDGPNPGPQSDESEADIDAEWSGATAPNATVDFVVSESTELTAGVDLSAVYVIENNLAPVMSESYGVCEIALGTSGNEFYSTLWAQAASQGITVILASGDTGANGCNYDPAQYGLNVSGFASTPYNVAIGGTDFNDLMNPSQYWSTTNVTATQESAKGYIPETTWNDSCTNSIALGDLGWPNTPENNCNNSQLINAGLVDSEGGSGGVSNCTTNSQTLGSCSGGYTKPSWQVAPGVPSDGKRDIPDVSLFASNGFMNNFYIFCQSDSPYPYAANCAAQEYGAAGGTSFGAPIFAGIMALINEKMNTPEGQGNANYVLYKLAGQQTASSCNSANGSGAGCVFNDITSGTIAMPCVAGSPNCTVQAAGHQYGILSGYTTGTGYDLATGLGSLNVANLLSKWNSVTFRPTTTILSLSPTSSLAHGQAVTFSGSVTPSSGSGVPSGDVSLITSSEFAVGGLKLNNGVISGSTDMLPGGSYTVKAHYAGDPTFGGSDSASISMNVGPETSKTFANLVTFDNNGNTTSFGASNATYGNGYFLLRFDVGNSSAGVSGTTGISSTCANGVASCPTGTVIVSSNGSPLAGGSFPLNVLGYAEDQSLNTGTYSISASYPGDASYGPSSATTTFTINKAPTTATAAVPGSPVEYGNSTQIDAAIATTSNGIAPTGTFTFFIDGTQTGNPVPVYESGPYSPNGSPPYAWADAISTAPFLSVGNHTLSASYSGDPNYASSTSAAGVVTVSKAQSFFLGYGATPNPAGWQQSVTLTARLYGSTSGIAPTGTMTFYDNGTEISGTVTYTPSTSGYGGLNGQMSYTPGAPGTHNITVSYSGDTNYTSATVPIPNVLTVVGPFSITPSGSVGIPSPGQSGSTMLTVSSNGGFTGTVTLTCSPDSNVKESTCNFGTGTSTSSSAQVTLNGSANATVQLNVTTTAPHAGLLYKPFRGSSGLALAGIFMLPITWRRSRSFFALLALATIMALVGCGGGSRGAGGGGGGNTDPGTGTGNYTFSVAGVSGTGAAAITVTSSVSVSVQ